MKTPWFFSTPAAQAALRAEIASWLGTPFKATACLKGVGADCVTFAAAVYTNVNAMGPIAWPDYRCFNGGPEMWAELHRSLEAIPNLVSVMENIQLVYPSKVFWENILPGDLLVHSSGRAFHHLAIFDEYPRAWHCLNQGATIGPKGSLATGVQEANVNDPACQKTLRMVYRFACQPTFASSATTASSQPSTGVPL